MSASMVIRIVATWKCRLVGILYLRMTVKAMLVKDKFFRERPGIRQAQGSYT
jgi:hypothetical protein